MGGWMGSIILHPPSPDSRRWRLGNAAASHEAWKLPYLVPTVGRNLGRGVCVCVRYVCVCVCYVTDQIFFFVSEK